MSAQALQFPMVLVVEHEPSDRIVLHQAFERAQTKAIIYWTQNGLEAMRWLQTAVQTESPLPECIIVDLKSPDAGAADLLDYLNGNDELRSIPVVVLGQEPRTETRSSSLQVKPFSFDVLVETSRAMGERWLRQHPASVN